MKEISNVCWTPAKLQVDRTNNQSGLVSDTVSASFPPYLLSPMKVV
jgi:hypothetical protein